MVRPAVGGSALLVWCCAAALAAPSTGRGNAPLRMEEEAGAQQALRSLLAGPEDPDPRELEALASEPGVASCLLELLASEAELDELDAGALRRLGGLEGTLRTEVLEAAVRDRLGVGKDGAWHAAALALVGRRGRAVELELAVRIAADLPEGHPGVSGVRDAALQLARSDPRLFDELAVMPLVRTEVAAEVVRAVGQAGDPRGVPWLQGQLRDANLCGTALVELGRLAPRIPPARAISLSEATRPFLRSEQANLRRGALRLLGALGDPGSAETFIELLASPSAGERRGAYDALRALSGCSFPAEEGPWRDWLEREESWWDERSEACLEQLESDEPTEVLTAVRELARHGLRRARLGEELARLALRHGEPAIRAEACGALEALRATAKLAELVDALEDPEPMVRARAHRALVAITGDSLPPDARVWSRALAEG